MIHATQLECYWAHEGCFYTRSGFLMDFFLACRSGDGRVLVLARPDVGEAIGLVGLAEAFICVFFEAVFL